MAKLKAKVELPVFSGHDELSHSCIASCVDKNTAAEMCYLSFYFTVSESDSQRGFHAEAYTCF